VLGVKVASPCFAPAPPVPAETLTPARVPGAPQRARPPRPV